MLRESAPHLSDKSDDRKHFPQRYRMDPYNALPCGTLEPEGNLPHPFGKSTPVLSVTHHLVDPKWQAEQNSQRQGQTVEEVAQV